MRSPTTWARGIGDSLSQLAGWVIGYTDGTNQSISGKAFDDYLTGKRLWPRRWINKLFRAEDHCREAWERDEERAEYETRLKASRRARYREFFHDN